MSALRVAAVAWRLRNIRGDGDFYGHFHDLVTIAHEEAADIVVIPENQSLELLDLAPDLEQKDVPAFLIQFADELEAWIDRISRSSGMIIVGGSHLRETSDGIKTVCAVGNADRGLTLIEKHKLTAYEREVWRLAVGQGLAVPADARLGVTIGYDTEFPEAGRVLRERGAYVHAVPAFTSDVRGFQSVRWCAKARAIENQVYVVHASLVGDLGREPVSSTYGSTAILTPSLGLFPEDACLGESRVGEEDVIVRTLDLDALDEARARAKVSEWNVRDVTQQRTEALQREDESA